MLIWLQRHASSHGIQSLDIVICGVHEGTLMEARDISRKLCTNHIQSGLALGHWFVGVSVGRYEARRCLGDWGGAYEISQGKLMV